MNLYLIQRPNGANHDEYDSAVVVAASPKEARRIHPNGNETALPDGGSTHFSSWVDPRNVIVELIGTANPHLKAGEVLCSSFNARYAMDEIRKREVCSACAKERQSPRGGRYTGHTCYDPDPAVAGLGRTTLANERSEARPAVHGEIHNLIKEAVRQGAMKCQGFTGVRMPVSDLVTDVMAEVGPLLVEHPQVVPTAVEWEAIGWLRRGGHASEERAQVIISLLARAGVKL